MSAKTKKSLLTLGKYLFWTGAGAIVTAIGAHIGDVCNLFSIPSVWQPVIVAAISATLKSVATYAATEAKL